MPEMILLETEEKMENAIEALQREFSKIRTGRANPKLLESVQVDYYGAPTPITQIGSIGVPEPTQLIIKPFDKTIVKDVEKAILAANIGVTPQNEGHQIRIVLPPLTTERRKQIVKDIGKLGERFKVEIRNDRRDGNDAIKKLEKASEISEDDSKGYQDEIQELTDKYTKEIDSLVKAKEEDILSI